MGEDGRGSRRWGGEEEMAERGTGVRRQVSEGKERRGDGGRELWGEVEERGKGRGNERAGWSGEELEAK